ncbi:alpha/beta hydrolase [Streptomyces chattanoogensis]|uniref:alpha/beta hydrolase n=1 Tax=Streptomyces chattanoogensis TaxID=66876 RepID=UPI00367C164C
MHKTILGCVGWPERANNPQRSPRLDPGAPTILLVNSRHDPATGHAWARNVHRQATAQDPAAHLRRIRAPSSGHPLHHQRDEPVLDSPDAAAAEQLPCGRRQVAHIPAPGRARATTHQHFPQELWTRPPQEELRCNANCPLRSEQRHASQARGFVREVPRVALAHESCLMREQCRLYPAVRAGLVQDRPDV